PDLTLLGQLAAMPFWNRLTSLRLALPPGNPLTFLADRLPPALEELALFGGYGAGGRSWDRTFFERLVTVPLRSLHLNWVPARVVPFERLLGETSAWRLRKLSLDSCGVTAAQARAIAGSPGAQELLSLELLRQVRPEHWELDTETVRALASSP